MAQPQAVVKRVRPLKLRPIKNDLGQGRVVWCGPAVISSITGRKLSVVMRELKMDRYGAAGAGVPAIKGTRSGELYRVLRLFGYRMIPSRRFRITESPTLAAWLRSRERPADLNIVEVTDHWVAVKGRKFIDSRTKAPVWLKDAPGRRKRVKEVWRIVPA